MTQESTTHDLAKQQADIEKIQSTVCAFYEVQPEFLYEKRGSEPGVTRRQVAMFLCRQLTGASFPEIAKAFMQTHHKTAQHANAAVSEKMIADSQLREEVSQIIKQANKAIAEAPKKKPKDWKADMVTR